FFFQAEDGIRDRNVTGVQTCALPISIDKISPIGTIQINELALLSIQTLGKGRCAGVAADWLDPKCIATLNDDHTLEWLHANQNRSEERRVGKKGSTRTPRNR